VHHLIRGSDRKSSPQNPEFCAGLELDAFGPELPGFHGFLEKGFGLDYYGNVLRKNRYALFQGLRSRLAEASSGSRTRSWPARGRSRPICMTGSRKYRPGFFGARR
jgi:hypothetical protein